MFKLVLTISILSAAMCTIGCGKDKKDEGASGEGASAAKAAPADDGPTLECSAFATKMAECIDPFSVAYAETKVGGKAGKQTDGTYDREMAASNFKSLWNIKGEKMCSEEFVNRDSPWKKRFAGCDNTAACDVWVPCMSKAMGDMMN